ncbi:hypothetical protein RUM44_004401 [Polyplax serrata]|uniref:La-related protein 7 n=1 Tax=Polyplax serrata TaxID=468196 RepID=A0ABR1B2Q5_POLSC
MQSDMYFENEQEEIPKAIRRRKKQLYECVRERMEFYFSDSNLQKDRFLSQLIKNDPQIDLEVFLKFNRIQQLTDNINDLRKALKKSEFLSLTEDKTKVFRNTPVKEKANVDACTIYVEQLSCDADHDWLKLIFSRYGKVDYVSIPKYRSTGKIKGFAFVEFETPEAANAALEEFEKEGCSLTAHMNPEKLCSIATFEDDKFDSKTHKQQVLKVSDENEYRKSTKRKFDKVEEKDNESEPEGKRSKKEKHKSQTVEAVGGDDDKDEENEQDDTIRSNNNIVSQDEMEPAGDVPIKKKKNRKKKKSLKSKYKDIKIYGLQILSKSDWKRLRNKYLNIQKEKMKKLKQHLYKSQMNYAQKQLQITNQVVEPATKPRFQFSKGLIVKICFDTPIRDGNHLNQFKCDAKTTDKVEYVDVEIGSTEAYVRFSDEKAVEEAVRGKRWENMYVMEGDEEQEYWEKMKRDRCEKFENKKKFAKRRGRNKIIDKTEKLMSKRIRLSVDE